MVIHPRTLHKMRAAVALSQYASKGLKTSLTRSPKCERALVGLDARAVNITETTLALTGSVGVFVLAACSGERAAAGC